MNVREALGEYLASKRGEIEPKTYSEARRIVGYFADWCNDHDIQLEQIKPKTIHQYTEFMCETHKGKSGDRLSTHTAHLNITIIKAFLNYCALDEEMGEFITPTTVNRIKKPKQEITVVETFTSEQIEAMLQACDTINKTPNEKLTQYLRDRDRCIVMILVDVGLRAQELCTLRMKYLELSPDDPHIQVFGKGSKWREIGLGERCRKELRRYINKYRASERGTDAYVFLTRRGEQMKVQTLYRAVRRLGDAVGIQGIHVHQFRHTYAQMFMRETGDIFRLSRLMGHTSIRITSEYLKSFTQQEARRGAISPLDRL